MVKYRDGHGRVSYTDTGFIECSHCEMVRESTDFPAEPGGMCKKCVDAMIAAKKGSP